MTDVSDMDYPDYDIAIIYQEDVNRLPARKTNIRAGSHDSRCIPSYREAQWNSLDFASDSSCSGLCSDCAEPCSLYEAGIAAGV